MAAPAQEPFLVEAGPEEAPTVTLERPLANNLEGMFSNRGGQEVADRFTVTSPASVTHLTWYGYYGIELAPTVSSLLFNVSFLPDASGVPGERSLSSQEILASAQSTGHRLNTPASPWNATLIYRFDADLPSPLPLSAGLSYWLSIAETDVSTPQWLWARSSSATDLVAYRVTRDGVLLPWTASHAPDQAAFALGNGVVPAVGDDLDGDGIPNRYETANGLDPNADDALQDLDGDGLGNRTEYLRGTAANKVDTDGDGLPDGVESGTGVYVGANNTGTHPLKGDSDYDGLGDAVETNTGIYVNATNTGTNPNTQDSDRDGIPDGQDVAGQYNFRTEANPDGTLTVYKGPSWPSGVLVIPATLEGRRVTRIGSEAFAWCGDVTNVTIGTNVTEIGNAAFIQCVGLAHVSIPASVTRIGEVTFSGCTALATVTIPDGITQIGEMAFSRSGLTTLRLPSGMSVISGHTFQGCSQLTNVALPDRLTRIGRFAFHECTALRSITFPDSLTTIAEESFGGAASLTSLTIPNGVMAIGSGAFMRCSGLTNVAIGDGLTSLGNAIFASCPALTRITIGKSVTRIEGSAFADCSSLAALRIPQSVTNIAPGAFTRCASMMGFEVEAANPAFSTLGGVLFNADQTRLVTYPAGLVGDYVVPEGVSSIADSAFADCRRLSNVTLANSIIDVGSYAFSGCTELAGIAIGSGLHNLGDRAFAGCTDLRAIEVDARNGAYSSRDGVLFDRNETSLLLHPSGRGSVSYTIPNGVTRVGDGAFENCSTLKSITLPETVSTIGQSAFAGCAGLNGISLSRTITSIGPGAFSGCTGLTGIGIPDGVTSVEYGAFYGCAGLTEVTLPDSVTSVQSGAFWGCSSLTNVTLGSSVGSIGDDAFRGTRLTCVTLPDSVRTVHPHAFWDLDLTRVHLGSGFQGDFATFDSSSLTEFTVSEANPFFSSSDGVLLGNRGTTLLRCPPAKSGSYIVPQGVMRIEGRAFSGCAGLTAVTFPASVTRLGSYVFGGCFALGTVFFEGDAPVVVDERDIPTSEWALTEPTVVYYLPGAEGWRNTFSSRPTAHWVRPNPTILDFGDRFGPSANGFSFVISWAINVPVVVETSANLTGAGWTPISTNTLTGGWVRFTDPDWQSQPARFYRVRGGSGGGPMLSSKPILLSPADGAVLDNGRLDRNDGLIWDFDWEDVPGAVLYHLYVIGGKARFPVVDNPAIGFSAYSLRDVGAYIVEDNRWGWTWKVRAFANGLWSEWSETRSFDVEPPDTDPPAEAPVFSLPADPATLTSTSPLPRRPIP